MKKLLLLFIVSVTLSINAYAGVSITPARSEIVMEKEQTFQGVYAIENGFDSTLDISITYATWNNSPENKDALITDWLNIPVQSVRLAPGERKEIGYTVKSLDYKGSLSAMVSFTHKSPGHQGINLMTSVPIYVTIAGTEKVDFEITSVKAEKSQKSSNYVISYLVKNNGNVPLRVKGSLKVLKGKKVVAQQPIGEQSPVYAGKDRGFYESLASLEKGKYVLNISLNALGKSIEKNIQIRVNKYGDISY